MALPATRSKLLSLELIRGLAAVTIVLGHAPTQIALHPQSQVQDFHGGWQFPPVPGIEVFFVVSGFAMMLAHAGDFGAWRGIPRFLWNRAVRIYPLYWLVMAELFRRLLLPDWHTLQPSPFHAWSYFSWFTLLPAWDPELLPVAWTLRFEVAFYLMFALCLLPRVGLWIMAVWFVATLVTAQIYTGHVPGPLSHVLDPFTLDFFAGMAAGYAYRRYRPRPAVAWLLVGAGVLLVACRLPIDLWGFGAGPWWARLVYGSGYAGVAFGLASLERAQALTLGRWSIWLGLVSYPLYLSHPATLDHGIRWLGAMGFPARYGVDAEFVVLLALCGLVGAVLAVAVDQPIQRWLRWRRLDGGSAVVQRGGYPQQRRDSGPG